METSPPKILKGLATKSDLEFTVLGYLSMFSIVLIRRL